ncbi:hypothetical protein LOTGIDRAFT_118598, partial [Lottia gigantea]
ILEKRSADNKLIFDVRVGENGIEFLYLSSLSVRPLSVSVKDTVALKKWHHLAIQVYRTTISFFLNGPRVGLSSLSTTELGSVIQDSVGSYRIGQTAEGLAPFKGRLQDFQFYQELLTNREIAELFSGTFPEARIQTDCRCPPTHPRVKPQQTHYCIPNGVPDNSGVETLRINDEAHPLEFANDGDSNTVWISKFQDKVDVTVDLGDEFQVFYVVIQFYSPLPKAVTIERQINQSDVWEPWQYYAQDCPKYFTGQVNNGETATSLSVNCLQFGTNNLQTPYSRGNITFNILSSEPVPRPGYNDFYNTLELHEFVKASRIRVRFEDHYFVTNIRHEYFGVFEYAVSARCNCHGHSETCDMSTLPYKCNCLPASNTQGNQCEKCLPLYNNKPFRVGDQTKDYNCQLCQCYNHATSCYYNASYDSFPTDHDRGGGGVCVDCQHNTEGQMCDVCKLTYFRPIGKSLYDADVCQNCNCNATGMVSETQQCEKIGGQCPCKEKVSGRDCSVCLDGFYNIQPTNPVGCEECGCNVDATINADKSCDIETGQCNCKRNVRNRNCDECEYGFYNLTSENEFGCQPCQCNPMGSQSIYCDPDSGQCQCKENIIGLKCDRCADNFYNFSLGCIPCNCNKDGIEPGSVCDHVTGQCVCKQQVGGRQCNTCKEGAYGFGSSPNTGCEICTCNLAGIEGDEASCDFETGSCKCKERVIGRMCNRCDGNTWGLNETNPLGCELCNCDPTGTKLGETTSPDTLACNNKNGQCSCLANRFGRQCEQCVTGYFNSETPGGGCEPCGCQEKGTLPGTMCNTTNGQCECYRGRGLTGRTCSECENGFYGFDEKQGECSKCLCLEAGSVNQTCQSISGQCYCKEFVTGRQCDICVQGSSKLEMSNPFGCSKSPSQQPPPTHVALSSTELLLEWGPPDYPNGVIYQYNVIRDVIFVHLTNLFSVSAFNDTGLLPYTSYTYQIEAINAFGSVRSTPVIFRTLEGFPSSDAVLQVFDIKPKSASFRWTEPSEMNGPLLKYKLVSQTSGASDVEKVHWEGTSREVTLTSLIPFTKYNMSVEACTAGGCTKSSPILVNTPSSVPEGQRSPNITAINNTALFINWDYPINPNGIIIFYELWMQGMPGPNGIRNPESKRVFVSSGQYNPRVVDTPEENALPPPDTNYTVTDLEPFTEYEFQVLAQNDAGKAASPWTVGRTGEALPNAMGAPVVEGLSSSQLKVSWTEPPPKDARGVILIYHVYHFVKTDLTQDQFAPPFQWKLVSTSNGSVYSTLIDGLTPYSQHNFKIGACNSVGCVNSTSASGRLLPAAPEGVVKPTADGYNSTVMSIRWPEPTFPNGPSPNYVVEKTSIALSYPPQVDKGTRFPGGGYYIFPSSVLPQSVSFTGIRLSFRLKSQSGLLLFAATETQEEFIAIQFDEGRPKFLFDTQGNIGYITTTNDEGLRYTNGDWYYMTIRRSGIHGTMLIDANLIRDTGCQSTSVIGQTTAIYVGGLPPDFVIKRNDRRASIQRTGFQGCLSGIEILQQESPFEVWKKLDWKSAEANELAFLNWEGCPVNLDKGLHFLGQGKHHRKMIGGDEVEVQFQFRTALHTGLLFFTYGGTGIYMYAGLIQGDLYFEFSNGVKRGSVTYTDPDINFCDGNWRQVYFRKTGFLANITIENGATTLSGDAETSFDVPTASSVYVGGIPQQSEAKQFMAKSLKFDKFSGFGGCIAFFLVNTKLFEFYKEAVEVVNVNMDGCAPFFLPNDTCKDNLITQVYEGVERETFDIGLQPYTDYIYRVTATNEVGSGSSAWGYGRTKEGAPVGVNEPYEAKALSGYTIQAEWNRPDSTSGLLTKFILIGYVSQNDSIEPITQEFTDTKIRTGNLTNCVPYTDYLVKIIACTAGGCTESEEGVLVRTLAEAPEQVPAPTADVQTTSMIVKWEEPGRPNGLISGYYLFQDDVKVYEGGENFFELKNLQVYTSYRFFVRACTSAGCTSGPTVTLTTAQLPPTSVLPPVLQVLGTNRIDVRWKTPDQANGALERYVLLVSTIAGQDGTDLYNSTELFLSTVLTNLTAGTQYFIRLSACTGGGCTTSDVVNATTEESAPDGIPDPVVTSPSWAELEVSWGIPALPNGIILRYELYHNKKIVHSSLVREYRIDNLQPYSLHEFRVAACTIKGCGFSNEVQARTMEAPPEGLIVLEVVGINSRAVNTSWSAPAKTNGRLFYDVYFEGLYYKDPEKMDYRTDTLRKSLLQVEEAYKWFNISNLIPLSQYSIQVNASNTKGFILSNVVLFTLPPGTPDGVSPPQLVSETPNSIKAQWPPVGRVNADEEPSYILQFREDRQDAMIQDIFGPTSTLLFTKENLLAFTTYQFRVKASNTRGSTISEWASQVTKQDRPVGVNPPQIVNINMRYIDLKWSQPFSPNGIIMHFNIYQNSQLRAKVEANVTSERIDNLLPYSYYIFKIEACTLGGCTKSDESLRVRTLQAAPEFDEGPTVISLTPASVEIKWKEPIRPNGVITSYSVERRVNGSEAGTVLISTPATVLSYIDEDPFLSPFTSYDYRVAAENFAGAGYSPWTTVVTKPSRPSGVMAPEVQVINSTAITVKWTTPIKDNGLLEFYIIRLPEPRVEIRNTSQLETVISGLTPFTDYSVTLTACTSGGCSESVAVPVKTLAAIPGGIAAPNPIAVSQLIISITWQPPSQPNGQIIAYELSRQKIAQPLDPTVTDIGEWSRVYSGKGLFYEDRGLTMFTTYIYRVTVFNGIGQITSDSSKNVTTFGGLPRRPAVVAATPTSHLTIKVDWQTPDPVDLQGEVEKIGIVARSTSGNVTAEPPPDANSYILENLSPDTEYSITVKLTIYGGESITSNPVTARTMNGAPEGIEPPVLTVLSDTSLRVSWSQPSQSNGQIVNYNIYINNDIRSTNMSTPGSIILNDLQPFTVYRIKVEACTQFKCASSDPTLGTTSESLPQGLANPTLEALSPTSVRINWAKPQQENGIIRNYELSRKTLKKCSEISEPQVNPELTKCTYIECSILESRCGNKCYTGQKRCCNGVIHDAIFGYECCESQYVPKPSVDAVCCGGKFYNPLPNYKCCGKRYILVEAGTICCGDSLEDRVTIGYGDSCCGSVPYSTTGSQICCTGTLYGGYNKQCCGGQVVSQSAICCGNDTSGDVYLPQSQKTCCGRKYVDQQTTLCCTSDTEHTKVRTNMVNLKTTANEKCCGMERIGQSLSCCNYVGYNPATQVCSDKSSTLQGCGTGTVCPISQTSTAVCNRCDFNSATQLCGAVTGFYTNQPPTIPSTDDMCIVDISTVFTGLQLTYTDTDLTAFTRYEYSVTVSNNAGSISSEYVGIKTLPAPPENVKPPNTRVNPEQLYAVYLTWETPGKPNGEITQYLLRRNNVELYRGTRLMYTDDNNILPYQTYTYKLTVCNIAGCTDSNSVQVATAESAPEGLSAPVPQPVNSTAIRITWSPPTKPNGLLLGYTVIIYGKRSTFGADVQEYLVTGLVPYKEYQVSLEACTVAGCTKTDDVTAKTLEALPQGLAAPKTIIIDSTAVEVYWTKPQAENGLIIKYILIRRKDGIESVAYRGTELVTQDLALLPETTYEYAVEAENSAGKIRSGFTSVITPKRTPAYVPPPKNVTAVSSTAVFIDWDPVAVSGVVDQYRVLLTEGATVAIDRSIGLDTSTTISGLKPYTEYNVRLQVCLMGVINGCGTGQGVKVRTFEAPPLGMAAPALEAKASDSILVSWKVPEQPNGVIKRYLVYKRKFGETSDIIVNESPGIDLSFTHAGRDLLPFTTYEYRIVAYNGVGDVSSDWSRVRTLEAVPEGFSTPTIDSSDAHGFRISWNPPTKPNGIITMYNVYYKEINSDPTIQSPYMMVSVNTTSTSVSGLKPYSEYDVRVEAVNSAGGVSSINVRVQTMQSSPAGLLDFSIEKIDSGQALILRWNPPLKPNGVISNYKIYEDGVINPVYQGLNREFEFRRLEPYTEYTVSLEACTSTGCTKGKQQTFRTAETLPSIQPSPTTGLVNATHVLLKWVPPVNPNGKILSYEVLRRQSVTRRKRDISDPQIVYKTLDTSKPEYEFMDSGLKPNSNYEYQVRATNAKGSTTSPWISVSTGEAAPDGVQPPRVSHIGQSVNMLLVEWDEPAQPNGVIQRYQIKRNSSIPFSFGASDARSFTDSGLEPFTWYEYTLTACSGGGCTPSDPTFIRTKESAPLKVSPPDVTAVNSTAVKVTWTKPQVTNGAITLYVLYMDGSKIYEGLNLEHTVSGLLPYNLYRFYLQACTNGGCASSTETSGRPDDSKPEDMRTPTLRVMSSTSIEVSWRPPQRSNGIISSYDVRRGDQLIYTESLSSSGTLKTSHTDYSLLPGEEYTYTVIARNRKGSAVSPPATARTYASSPSGLDPPSLVALSSTSVQATWKSPIRPNGVLVNYTLFQGNDRVYSGPPNKLSYIVPGLQYWTEHTFRIQACTVRGCELSEDATVRTLEAIPEEQGKPSLLPLADENGASDGVFITWDPPLKPNGVIKRYDVKRRLVVRDSTGVIYGDELLVYNGTANQHTDRSPSLLPFTEYQYLVSSFNSIGRATSLWESVTTKEAPPTFVPTPTVTGTTSTTIDVTIMAPAQPNGIIRLYNIVANGTVVSIGSVLPLSPFTTYSLKVRACTGGGCTDSSPVTAKTGTAKPSGLEPLVATSLNSTSVKLTWSQPLQPNGQIIRYLVFERTACPLTAQPYEESCVPGDSRKVYEGQELVTTVASLEPYTAYEYQLQAENQAGGVDFPTWVRVETAASDPKYMKIPVLTQNDTKAVIDWTESFILNSKLREYILSVDGVVKFRGITTVYGEERRTKTQGIFFIQAVTEVGEAETPSVIFDPGAADNLGTTTVPPAVTEKQSDEIPFYQEIWFIVLVCILSLLLLFILIVLCVRYCGKDRPYVRERRPLYNRQPKSPAPLTYMIDPNGSVYETVSF